MMDFVWFVIGFVAFPVIATLALVAWIRTLIWREQHPPRPVPTPPAPRSAAGPLPAWVEGLEAQLETLERKDS